MRGTFWLVAVALLVFCINALTYITQQGNEQILTLIGDLAPVVIAACAAIGCWIVYSKIDSRFFQEKRCWLFTAVALTLFTLGDIYWGYSEVVLGVKVPIGSIADWLWTSAYIALLFGVFYVLAILFFGGAKKQMYTIAALTVISAIIYLFVHIADLIKGQEWINVVQELYVFYDIILLGMILALLLPLIFSHNRMMNVWLLFGLSFVVRIVFDFVFAGLTAVNMYSTGNFIDLIYNGSYLLLVFAIDSKIKMLNHSRKK